mmetsp:Transcript_52882/g.151488  ORF Transcript_52882/g.151488 Transcript_52882/m.151488 type:complete len:259 (-) Transcript_52882:429-1205(-)
MSSCQDHGLEATTRSGEPHGDAHVSEAAPAVSSNHLAEDTRKDVVEPCLGWATLVEALPAMRATKMALQAVFQCSSPSIVVAVMNVQLFLSSEPNRIRDQDAALVVALVPRGKHQEVKRASISTFDGLCARPRQSAGYDHIAAHDAIQVVAADAVQEATPTPKVALASVVGSGAHAAVPAKRYVEWAAVTVGTRSAHAAVISRRRLGHAAFVVGSRVRRAAAIVGRCMHPAIAVCVVSVVRGVPPNWQVVDVEDLCRI